MMDYIPPRGDTHPDSPWYVGDEEMKRRKSGIDKYDVFGNPNDD